MAQEAAKRASADIKKREDELVGFFKKAGLEIHEVDRAGFQQAVLKNVPLESMGFTKADYDKVQAAK